MFSLVRPWALIALLGVSGPSIARANDADEAMSVKAVDWLLAQQHPNGGFGQIPNAPPGELGITGLAVKALAEVPPAMRDRARPAVERAVQFIVGCQQEDGSFAQGRSGLVSYRTSVSIMALAAVDRARHRDAIAKAAEWLKGAQWDEAEQVDAADPRHGGFGYGQGGRGGNGADLSNTQMALAALKDAGIAPDDPVFRRALAFVRRCQNSSETNDAVAGLRPLDDGGFFYDPTPPRDSAALNQDGTHSHASYAGITYAGLMSLLTCGASRDDAEVKTALAWIAANYTLEENRGMGGRGRESGSQSGLYYYFHAFAKCLATLGTPTIETADGPKRWARDLFAALAARQRPDGSFVNMDGRWWEQDPVLVTTYCISAMNYARPFLDD